MIVFYSGGYGPWTYQRVLPVPAVLLDVVGARLPLREHIPVQDVAQKGHCVLAAQRLKKYGKVPRTYQTSRFRTLRPVP